MQEIVELTKLWYEIVSLDHHKDRDCHFDITVKFSYGNQPTFTVNHYGYVANEFEEEYDSYEEAQEGLRDFIARIIAEEAEWAEECLSAPEKWNEDQHVRSKKILELIK